MLRRIAAAPPLSERCEASLQFAGEEYLHAWADILASHGPEESVLDRASSARTGDRLALCLAGYYYRASAPVDQGQSSSRLPRWVPALLAPGLPLLMDDQPSNDGIGYAWMGGDALALAGSVGFAFLSIDRRNAAAATPSRDLGTANAYLNASLISGAVFLASHVTSALVFGREDKAKAQAGMASPSTLFTW
jgi:hypothetical protein